MNPAPPVTIIVSISTPILARVRHSNGRDQSGTWWLELVHFLSTPHSNGNRMLFFNSSGFLWAYLGGNSDRNRVRRHVLQYNRVCAYRYVVADSNVAKNLRARADAHTIADNRRAANPGAPQPNSHAVANHAVIAEHRVPADDDVAEVLDLQPPADARFARNVDAGQYLTPD